MRAYISTGDGSKTFAAHDVAWVTDTASELHQIVCHPEHPRQRVIGFGGALTEASARVFAEMPAELQDEVLIRTFGPAERGGNAYTLCRTHLQSCDFSLGNYAYVRPPRRHGDVLGTFSIERDRSLLIPFIRCCGALAPGLSLVAAPWSPPAFMKTNRSMNGGGRLKESCYRDWARVLARAVAAWRAEGVDIRRLSVQNEPNAAQRWDSCLYTPAEEARFARDFLRPALDAEGLETVGLLAWDHNKERLVQRLEDMARALESQGASLEETYAGAAFHWYTGDHFEAIRLARELHPALELIHTEGCATHGPRSEKNGMHDAEHYAHDMIGDLNAGAAGYMDWNILLDEQGGPNHVGNYCDAPLIYDRGAARLAVNRSFSYIGHITRYIRPGARIYPTSCFTDRLETAGAANPDGGRVLVILNRGDRALQATVREGDRTAQVLMPAHSIQTLIWRP